MDQIVAGIIEMTRQGRRAQRRGIGQHFLDTHHLVHIAAGRKSEMHADLAAIQPGKFLKLVDLPG